MYAVTRVTCLDKIFVTHNGNSNANQSKSTKQVNTTELVITDQQYDNSKSRNYRAKLLS